MLRTNPDAHLAEREIWESVRNVPCLAEPVPSLYLLQWLLCTCRKVNVHESENGNRVSKVQLIRGGAQGNQVGFAAVLFLG